MALGRLPSEVESRRNEVGVCAVKSQILDAGRSGVVNLVVGLNSLIVL